MIFKLVLRMFRHGAPLVIAVVLTFVGASSALAAPPTETGKAVHEDISRPLRSIAAAPAAPGRAWPARPRQSQGAALGPAVPDQARQTTVGAASTASSVLTNWEGVSNAANTTDGAGQAVPPDTEGDVGLSDYVQWVNLSFEIWDKATGKSLYGPAAANSLWSGFGGVCQNGNQGDPQVVYDRIANRWVFMQFGFATNGAGNPVAPYYLCFAVSQTSDPTGSYYRYAFLVNSATSYFPDYPKLGVWPDGYYVTSNNFKGNTFEGAAAFAFDRSKMLTGDSSASFVEYQLGPSYEGLLPGDYTGTNLPPSGSPDYFGAVDTSSSSGTGSTFQLWKFHADFTTPTSSSFTGPTNLAVTPYTFSFCGQTYSSSCISQPGTTQQLDPLADRLMQHLQYRNFGDHETLIASHTVDVGSDVAGVRWYEIRGSPLSSSPAVYQQGTYAPADGTSRWMGSAAMDASGNVGLGYSMSSSSVYPSIGYTGRVATDPTLNEMNVAEATMIAGAGSQTTSYDRWGDYSAMSVDPSDDQTFWYTQEYYATTSNQGWQTRVGSFSLSPVAVTSPAKASYTNNTTPTFSGTASATPGYSAVTVKVYTGSAVAGTPIQTLSATVGTGGAWSVNAASALAQGTYMVQAQQSDGVGHTEYSAGNTFVVDTTPPAVSVSKVNGSTVTFPYYTNQNVTSIGGVCGTASGDSGTVSWSVTGTSSESGSVSCSSGAWSMTLPTALSAQGSYTVAATQGDQAGNTGSSGNQVLTIDKAAPLVSVSKVNGSTVTFPYYTNQNVTSIGGACGTASGDSGSVSWSVTGTSSESGSVSCSSGAWSVTLPTALSAQGSYALAATQGDQAGNTGSSGNQALTIDKTAPLVSLTSPANGSSTSNATPTYSGGAGTVSGDLPTITVNVYSGSSATGTPLQTLTATASTGSWSVTGSTALAGGTYTAQAQQSDSAGNTGYSSANTFSVSSTGPPPPPPSVSLTQLNGGTVTFPYYTNQNVSTIGGACTSGDGNVSWSISGASSSSGSVGCSSQGGWSASVSLSAEGSYTLSASQTNAGGTGSSGNQVLTIDKAAPLVSVSKVNGSTVTFPYYTNQNVTSIGGVCGTASGDSGTVSWSVTGTSSESGSVSCSSGAWSVTLPTALSAQGSYTVAATQGDQAGNTGSSGNQVLTIDKAAPLVSVSKVNGSTVTFPYYTNQNVTSIGGACGTASGDSGSVSWSVTGTSSESGSVSCSSGSWSMTLPTSLSAQGSYTLSASQSDQAGNTGSSGNQALTIDKAAPLVSVSKVNGSTVTFPYYTNQNVTSIGGACGTASGDSATVDWSVTGGANEAGSAACSSGTWSATLTTQLSADGSYTLAASQSDQAGNTGSSGNQSLTIAKTPPAPTVQSVDIPPSAAFAFSPLTPLVGQAVSFDGSGSSDPDGAIVSYAWSFGDGSPQGTGAKPTHIYSNPGTYAVQLSVTDNSGSIGATARSLTVSPAPLPRAKPPVIALRIPKQRLGSLLNHGLLVQVRSDQLVSANLQLLLKPAAAKTWKLGNGKRAVAIASWARQLMPNRVVAVTLKLTRAARRHLATVRTLRVTIALVLTGGGGRSSISQSILLRR